MTNLDYLKIMVKSFPNPEGIPFKDILEPIVRAYTYYLKPYEQKEFCQWLAGPNPRREEIE